ncbi:MAG: cytochrome C biogenesis protein [Bacillaceae bacterium G1]|nr:MAG: cytochrome C biogenesis protein [Bacillaceae bacterium G1]
MAGEVTIWLAFLAGVLSFVSPCMLPLYPSYLSYITGVSVEQIRRDGGGIWRQRQAMLHTVCFIFGFSIIFFALGLSASFIGQLFLRYQTVLQVVGGIVIMLMGLLMLGIFNPAWLMQERRYHFRNRPLGYVGSFLIGVAFAAGWTPCIGPILTAVLMLGATNPSKGIWMITVYVIGFAIPFFLMAFFMGKWKVLLKRTQLLMRIGGAMMILVGFLLMTDQLSRITVWLIRLYGGFSGF